ALAIGRFNVFDNEAAVGAELLSGYRAAFAGATQVVPATELRLAVKNSLELEVKDQVRWVETTLLPLVRRPDGAATHVLGIQRDVTELMRSREEIEAARRQIGSQRDTIDSLETARRETEAPGAPHDARV